MALKFKIDAVDAEVKNLEGSFAALSKFAAEAKVANSKWAQFSAQAEETVKVGQRLQNLYTIEGAKVELLTHNQSRFATVAGVTSRVFSSLARDTKSLASNLLQITYSFASLGLITAGITGLLGVGVGLAGGYSFFGLENLAARMSAGRRSAMQMGANFGGLQSFDANLSRFVDPPAFLGNVAGGRYDLTSGKRLALMVAGIDTTLETSEQAARLLERTPGLLRGVPDEQILSKAGSLGLLEHFSPEEIVRAVKHPEELKEMAQKYRENKGRFDVPPGVLEAWARMMTQLEGAGQILEGRLAENLKGLAEPLAHLSRAFTARVNEIIKSKFTEKAVAAVSEGIKNFADQLMGEQFQKDMGSFIRGIKELLPVAKRIFGAAVKVAKVSWNIGRLLNPYDNYGMPGHGGTTLGEVLGGPGRAPAGHPIQHLAPNAGSHPRDRFPNAPSIRRHTRQWSGREGGESSTGTHDEAVPGYEGLNVLPGHGATEGGAARSGLVDVARTLQRADPTVGFTALNDTYHQHGGGSGPQGAHGTGRAFDATMYDIEADKQILRDQLARSGFQEGGWQSGQGDYSIEPGTGGGTGPHLHFQWNSNEAAARYHEYVRREHNRTMFGHRGRQRQSPQRTSFLSTIHEAAHAPKRVTVINESTSAVGTHAHVYG